MEAQRKQHWAQGLQWAAASKSTRTAEGEGVAWRPGVAPIRARHTGGSATGGALPPTPLKFSTINFKKIKN
jgi:hypothetical protein